VAGVIDDLVESSIDEPIRPAMYVFRPPDQYDFVVLARLKDPLPTDAELLHEFTTRWGERAPRRVIHVRDAARAATAHHRARVVLLGAIAVLIVPLMLFGVAGTILHTVGQETRALALSLALGGDAARLRFQMVWRIAAAALCAVAGGLMVGLMATRVMAASGGPVAPDRVFVAVSVAAIMSALTTVVAWIASRSVRRIQVFQVLRDC
jgi:ABC-type antimicrobial peptide transport system permease subunit